MKANITLSSVLVFAAAPLVVKAQGFLNTCCGVRSASAGTVVTAKCLNTGGGWVSTSINLDQCLANINGQLVYMANGAFSLSCKNCGFYADPDIRCPATRRSERRGLELGQSEEEPEEEFPLTRRIGSPGYVLECTCNTISQGGFAYASIELNSVLSNWDGSLGC